MATILNHLFSDVTPCGASESYQVSVQVVALTSDFAPVDMWQSFLGQQVLNSAPFPLDFSQKDGFGSQVPALHPYACCGVT